MCYGAEEVKNRPSQFWKEPSHASGASFQRAADRRHCGPQGASVAFEEGRTLGDEDMVFDAETGAYTLFITLGFPGAYTLVLTGAEAATAALSYTETFTVTAAAWRKLLTVCPPCQPLARNPAPLPFLRATLGSTAKRRSN